MKSIIKALIYSCAPRRFRKNASPFVLLHYFYYYDEFPLKCFVPYWQLLITSYDYT